MQVSPNGRDPRILTVDQLEDFDPMGDVPNPSCAGKACDKIRKGLKKMAKTLKRKKSRKKKSNSSDEEINPNDLYNLGGGVKTRKKSSKKGGKRKSRRKKRRRRTRRRKRRRKKSRKRKRFRK